LIVGAGEMASLFFDDLGIGIPDIYKPVCIVDDDPAKLGRKLGGVTVIGKTDDIPKIVKEQRIDTIIVCINHIDEANRKRIFTKCNESGCTVSKMTLGVNENVENKIKAEFDNAQIIVHQDPFGIKESRLDDVLDGNCKL